MEEYAKNKHKICKLPNVDGKERIRDYLINIKTKRAYMCL